MVITAASTFGLSAALYADICQVLRGYPSLEQVLIFGSRAKDTAKTYSDYDFAIFALAMSDAEFTALWHELNDLPMIFKLDVLHWNRLREESLKNKILTEGRLFYSPTMPNVFSQTQ
ncbi:MAG: nucleotidyltransferase domain-containing protein [Gammaproteobacteria bacterium]|nr:nucleotidyltransferase domain-containing protein [Gammaproteobacteria bacterium]